MEKVSAAIRKVVKSLSTSKGRRNEHAFVTERTKNVLELLNSSFRLRWLIAGNLWFESHKELHVDSGKCLIATRADMERMTSLNTPSEVIAVFELPEAPTDIIFHKSKLYLALDAIQDPGNLGTIIRLADWFGVDTILAGAGTVDAFNPKCIISSMGSISRVKVFECNLEKTIATARHEGLNIWGTFMDGTSIYDIDSNQRSGGIIVMGNEGNGISPHIAELVSKRITIPSFPPGSEGPESLNVAMATAIILSEFRRTLLQN